MPVQINKLVVRATVRNSEKADAKTLNQVGLSEEERLAIIEESVSQVLSILERKKSR